MKSNLEEFGENSIVLVLIGIHGCEDGKIGKTDETLRNTFQGVVDMINNSNASKLTEKKISIRTADVGLAVSPDDCKETIINEEKLMEIIEKQTHVLQCAISRVKTSKIIYFKK